MVAIDRAQNEVSAEWNRIWLEADVALEVKDIDFYSSFFLAIVRVLSKVPSDGVVLEGGCGVGRWLLHCGRYRRILGLERCERAIVALKSFAPGVDVACGNVFRLPICTGSIDCYLSFGVMEHCEDGPIVGLREAYRALKPGGILLISGPGTNHFSFSNAVIWITRCVALRKLLGKPSAALGKHFFQYRFRPAEMIRFLESVGFRACGVTLRGNLEMLWQYFPFLRHSETRCFSNYHDLVKSGMLFRLNRLGMVLHKLIRKFLPSLMAYAWIIEAEK
jgi:SAM-dependent methyltransferase